MRSGNRWKPAVSTQVQKGLAGVAQRGQLLVVHLRLECAAVSAACARAAISVDNARRQLRVVFLCHQDACRCAAVAGCMRCGVWMRRGKGRVDRA